MVASRHVSAKCFLFFLCAANITLGLSAAVVWSGSLVVSLLFFCSLILYVVLGVTFVNLQVFAPAFCRSSTSQPVVAITFDDGPDPRSTPKVLQLLKSNGAKATFFCIGKKIDEHSNLVRAIIADGHEIQCHGYEHAFFSACWSPARYARDLNKAREALARHDVFSTWFRPPFGVISPRVAREANRAQLQICGWSCKANDGISLTSAENAIRNLKDGLQKGAILLMHDVSHGALQPTVFEILETILKEVNVKNLQAMTVTELFKISNHE